MTINSWLAERLLAWFHKHARDLPWRRNRDPYAIWVSEVMLQQTQAATVIPYFERFLLAFPTIADLAAADEQAVLRHWEGLGYYRRARDLLRAAKLLVREHGSQIPADAAAVTALPGFGRYTTGAVLSQAYGLRLPIVEANSRRLLARFFGCELDLTSTEAVRWLWQTAESILPPSDVGHFNQALMELGALVCTARTPNCAMCPVAERCWARQQGRQEHIPNVAKAKETAQVAEVAVVIRRARRVLLVQRPEVGRWANMWEFPHTPLENDEAPLTAAVRLGKSVGLTIVPHTEIVTLQHSVTRYRITMTCIEAVHQSGRFASTSYTQGRWLMPGDLGEFPVSSPQRRLVQTLLQACDLS